MTTPTCYELIYLQAPTGLRHIFDVGRTAYLRWHNDKKTTVCPYQDNTTEKYYWELGWTDEKEFREWLQSDRHRAIEHLAKADCENKTINNPYPTNSRESEAYDAYVRKYNE
jgi:hypothetical protein